MTTDGEKKGINMQARSFETEKKFFKLHFSVSDCITEHDSQAHTHAHCSLKEKASDDMALQIHEEEGVLNVLILVNLFQGTFF